MQPRTVTSPCKCRVSAKRREEPKTAATEATIRQAKYDKANTSRLMLKLNKKTDADILRKLGTVESKQGYIKSLIRADIAKSKGGQQK